MSIFDAVDPECQIKNCPNDVDVIVIPRSADLGGFEVRRVLPSREKRMVGPFVFWDQMGPNTLNIGQGLDVRPHPHIGLATLTYLFTGEIVHRDNLGSHQVITPGDVNLMTAGSGIAHSERTDPASRTHTNELFGLQCWLGLPKEKEEMPPNFSHYAKASLPSFNDGKVQGQLVAGNFRGLHSPVKTASNALFVDIELKAGATFSIPAEVEERAIYIISGELELDRCSQGNAKMLVLHPTKPIDIKAITNTRFILLGGSTLDGPRHLWWNFVSSSKDRIEQAKQDWLNGKFEKIPGDEDEYIPLPNK